MAKPRRPGVRGMDWLIQRDHAETVPCPDCGEPSGVTCSRPEPHTGRRLPLENLPAHTGRIRAAGPIPDHTQESHR
ncbi:zinc finger domain-containing protein [Nocardia abscessus]|uniref:zinc finger domain-containing protein n=1 Tax=Nocardia abscessus TaxID=120957 RepID=UPI003CC7D412